MLDGGQALWVGRVDVARPAALGTLGLGLWADGAAGLKHVASLEQSQLFDMDAGGVSEIQQHHATLGHAS